MVVGYGPEEDSLKELATTLGLSPDVLTFLGYREDVAAVLPQADVFVFCSESEGTPNVVLEAMAAGLPVITTPAGDAAEVVVPSGAGYLVPFGDVKATTDSILWLARSPILRQKLGKAARNHIALHAATSQLAGRLMEIYADAARTTGRGRHGNLQERLSRCPGRLERQLD
jgi:glycosyltransferase involved in cell wall biosynthesis